MITIDGNQVKLLLVRSKNKTQRSVPLLVRPHQAFQKRTFAKVRYIVADFCISVIE